MHLNLPIFEPLDRCQNILIAGMGGGFDIFCGLPIAFTLQERGQRVHLANLTFSPAHLIDGPTRLTPTLVGVTADTPPFPFAAQAAALQNQAIAAAAQQAGLGGYFPEYYLARWLRAERGDDGPIWCFDKTGVRPLRENYRRLVDHLGIDGILLIDGGVDSLIRGDETEVGTFIEDSVSLAAVSTLDDVPVRLLGCLGLGAEQDLAYAHVFENIAALAARGALLGSCALTQQMPAYQAYAAAVLAVQDIPFQDPSVINSSIISAVQGKVGDYHLTTKTHGSRLWVSPLMALFWFFDLPAVAAHNPMLEQIAATETFRAALRTLLLARQNIRQRAPTRFPLA